MICSSLPLRALTRPIPSLASTFGGAAHAAAPLIMREGRLSAAMLSMKEGADGKAGATKTHVFTKT
jgi:hypothetical protein